MKTVYEDDETVVEVNDSGEVFVTVKRGHEKTKNTLRITPQPYYELALTAYSSHFLPSSFNGLGGFRLQPKQ